MAVNGKNVCLGMVAEEITPTNIDSGQGLPKAAYLYLVINYMKQTT